MTMVPSPEVTSNSRPRLLPHVRLHFDPVRQRHAVLAPERVYWPDNVALSILRRCNGTRTLTDIVQSLAEEYASPVEIIEPDVVEFVQSWTEQRLLTIN